MKYIKEFYEYNQYEKLITINENELFYTFVDYYYNSELISNNDRKILESYTNYSLSEYLINENFFDKLKDRYDKAATVVKNIPDNAKNALNSIIDAAKTSVDFVKNFGRMCYEFEDCTLCPCHSTNFCIDSLSNLQSLESSIKVVQIVEKWSAEHP